ncbi:MAG TPA: hypothetical protein VGI78_10790 [Acetobacteraceae bacterium]|jgi:hypothetical protein
MQRHGAPFCGGMPATNIVLDTGAYCSYIPGMENTRTVWIIRLRQVSTGHEADSMLFRGTEAAARAYAAQALAGRTDLELAGIRNRDAR